MARKKIISKQPQFQSGGEINPNQFYSDVLMWIQDAADVEPPYMPNSRVRDTWLTAYWHREPHLAGVINSVISIDANRGWSLIGGRNQVLRFTDVLHSWNAAPGLSGWRPGCSAAALSYYTTDMNAIIELGRDGEGGPLRGLFHVDPTRCKLTGNMEEPLQYNNAKRKNEYWKVSDFIRVASMPNIIDQYNGLGYCAVSRCLELAKIMVAIYQHDKEQLGAAAPRGLLLLIGFSEKAWRDAMEARKANLEGENIKYYGALQVLASNNPTADAKLVALSQLPANFNLQQFTSLLMYGYALCFGYDPSEFYPVQFGSLGRGTEMEVQAEKATGKGGKNFVLNFQEQMQRPDVLPDTLHFEFDERDDQGELLESQLHKSWVDTYRAIRETGLNIDFTGGISVDEFRVLLAEKNIIPREWTETEEDVEGTDEDVEGDTDTMTPAGEEGGSASPASKYPIMSTRASRKKRMRNYLLSLSETWKAIEAYPEEPIIRYRYPKDRIEILWERADDLLHRQIFIKARAGDTYKGVNPAEVLFENKSVTITQQDVISAIDNGRKRVGDEFGSVLDNEPSEGKRKAE